MKKLTLFFITFLLAIFIAIPAQALNHIDGDDNIRQFTEENADSIVLKINRSARSKPLNFQVSKEELDNSKIIKCYYLDEAELSKRHYRFSEDEINAVIDFDDYCYIIPVYHTDTEQTLISIIDIRRQLTKQEENAYTEAQLAYFNNKIGEPLERDTQRFSGEIDYRAALNTALETANLGNANIYFTIFQYTNDVVAICFSEENEENPTYIHMTLKEDEKSGAAELKTSICPPKAFIQLLDKERRTAYKNYVGTPRYLLYLLTLYRKDICIGIETFIIAAGALSIFCKRKAKRKRQ